MLTEDKITRFLVIADKFCNVFNDISEMTYDQLLTHVP